MTNEEVQKISNNQRIFKSTMMLYICQIIIMLVGLYISRFMSHEYASQNNDNIRNVILLR